MSLELLDFTSVTLFEGDPGHHNPTLCYGSGVQNQGGATADASDNGGALGGAGGWWQWHGRSVLQLSGWWQCSWGTAKDEVIILLLLVFFPLI